MDSAQDKYCRLSVEGAYLQNCILWAICTSFCVFITTWGSDIFVASKISLHLLCQEIVGVKAFSFKKQNSTANQCGYNMGRGLYGYSGMSWNTWAGRTAGLRWDWRLSGITPSLSLSLFSPLLSPLCTSFLIFPFAFGHFSLLSNAFFLNSNPIVYLLPLQKTD